MKQKFCKRGHLRTSQTVYKNGLCKKCARMHSYVWAKNNKDYYKQYSKIWQKENTEKVQAASRRYRKLHLEKARENSRNWHKRNSKKVKQIKQVWNKKNPDKTRGYGALRRARIFAAPCEFINPRTVWIQDKKCCKICKKRVSFRRMHLDHIIPLSKGGHHLYTNVQTSCAPCNLSKNNKVAACGI